MNPIYLDYNATTPIDKEVADFMIPFLREHFGNPSSTHWYGIQSRKAVEEARKRVADFINCKPSEIIFTSGGTESNNMAITGVAMNLQDKGNHIITTSVEHPAVLEVCKRLEKQGFEVTYLDVNHEGMVDPRRLEGALRPSTILVTIMHANNEIGTIQPIPEIASKLNQAGIIFHTDAAQSAGKIPINVEEMGVSLLSLAGHKFYAPKGVGALYVKGGLTISKLMQGANHEQNLRPGTENVLEIAGLGKAAEIAGRDLEKNAGNMKKTRDLLYDLIRDEIPEVIRNGDPVHCLPNTLSLSFPGIDVTTLLSELDGVAASAGAACHADDITVSHVLQSIHLPLEQAMGTVRFSTGKHTTEEEIRQAATSIVKVARQLRPSGEKRESPAQETGPVKLTRYTHGLGCACKISPRILEEVLREMPVSMDKNVLVGSDTSDDAAVYRINDETAIVQTVDFFTPVIDDPYQFGAVAAANALSDIYAMGATPLFALNIVAFPNTRLPLEVLKLILDGANEVSAEAGISVLGGHTIEDNEPKFGMVVTGSVHPGKILMNSNARPGDDLILTKPLGTGILSTALKRGLVDKTSENNLYQTMRSLNRKAAEVMGKYPVNACTDVTGFGLLGHLRELCLASGSGAEVYTAGIPLLDDAYDFAAQGIIPGGTENNIAWLADSVQWETGIPKPMKVLLSDAQTSGGLLISIPSEFSQSLAEDLRRENISAANIIGRITPPPDNAVISVTR